MIISSDEEKVLVNVQHPFMIKLQKKLSIEGIYTIKSIYGKPILTIILNGEKSKPFPLKSRTRQEGPLSPPFFN
jgi:hypothetical protein